MPEQSSDSLLHNTQALIAELVRVLKMYWFYSEEHPAARELIRTLSIKMSHLVEEGSVTLNLTKEDVYLGAVPLERKNKNIVDFCRHLNKRRIYSLTFQEGLTDGEVAVMVQILALDPKQIRRRGGIRKQLNESNVVHIHISEYLYDQLVSDGVDEPPEFENEPMLALSTENVEKFQSYLRGEVDELPAVEEEILVDLMQNPARVSELMKQAIPSTLKIESNERISNSLRQFNQKIHKVISKRPKEEKKLLMRKVAASFMHQRPDTSLDVLTRTPTISSEQMDSIQEIVEHMSDDEILDLIVKNLPKDEEPEDIRPMISRLPVDSSRNLRLTQKYSFLLDQKRNHELDELELQKIRVCFNNCSRPGVLSDAIGILLELFETEKQTTVNQDIVDAIQKVFLELIILGQFDAILDLLQVFEDCTKERKNYSDEIKKIIVNQFPELITDEIIDKLIDLLDNATSQEEEKIVNILSSMDLKSDYIINIYANTSKIIIRRPLSRVLVRIGDPVVDSISDLIRSFPEDVAREFLSILGQIGSPKAIEQLKLIFPDVSITLQQFIVVVMGEFKSDDIRDWLIQRLRMVKDTQVRLACLDGLGKKEDRISIKVLREFAFRIFMKNDNERALQSKAIQLLGKLNVKGIVPDLIRIFHTTRWIPSKKRDQLRIVVAQTLWKMNDLDAKQTVRDGCRDYRRSVRHMCKSLVTASSTNLNSEG